jgi:hypothetical protein
MHDGATFALMGERSFIHRGEERRDGRRGKEAEKGAQTTRRPVEAVGDHCQRIHVS